MEAATKHLRRVCARAFGATLLAVVLLIALPGAARAANWGSDVYGGGTYDVGVVPAPAPTPAAPPGNAPPSGPLSVGYSPSSSETPAVVTDATTSTPLSASVTPIAPTIATTTATATLASVPIATTTAPAQVAPAVPLFEFLRSLQFRDQNADVKQLQQFLNAHGSPIAAEGPGSLGQETDYFGALTLAALIRFQNEHAEQILAPVGLTSGTGYFGPSTRAFVNAGMN